MQISNPAAEFLNPSVIAVLKVLDRAAPNLSGRSIAHMVEGFSLAQVNLVLRKFEQLGLLEVVSLPPAKLYTLNRANLGTKALLALTNQFQSFLSEASTKVANWEIKPKAVWLFGSAARGEASFESDIDLIFIWAKPTWDRHPSAGNLESFESWALSATGNEPNLLNVSMSELEIMIQKKAALIGQLRRDAKVVWGATPEYLLAKR